MKKMLLFISVMLMNAVLFAQTTYYVKADGDDSNDGTTWAKGKLTTNGVTVLCGISPNEGNAPVYEYDIIILNDNEMMLAYPEPGAPAWGTAWFWAFKAQ